MSHSSAIGLTVIEISSECLIKLYVHNEAIGVRCKCDMVMKQQKCLDRCQPFLDPQDYRVAGVYPSEISMGRCITEIQNQKKVKDVMFVFQIVASYIGHAGWASWLAAAPVLDIL